MCLCIEISISKTVKIYIVGNWLKELQIYSNQIIKIYLSESKKKNTQLKPFANDEKHDYIYTRMSGHYRKFQLNVKTDIFNKRFHLLRLNFRNSSILYIEKDISLRNFVKII